MIDQLFEKAYDHYDMMNRHKAVMILSQSQGDDEAYEAARYNFRYDKKKYEAYEEVIRDLGMEMWCKLQDYIWKKERKRK